MDGRTDGRTDKWGATLNAAPGESRFLSRSNV